MNREVKFRGFSKELNKWFYGALDNTLNWADFINTNEHGFSIKNRVESDSIGEFTGLKDKNGVEIYEGDIILSYGNKYLVDFTPCDGLKLCIIYPSDFEIKGIVQTHENWSYNKVSCCNILGNIHENAELLNK